MTCLSSLTGASSAQAAAAPATRVPFQLTVPSEFRGSWRGDPIPGVHPVDRANGANIRFESYDAVSEATKGHLDYYRHHGLCLSFVNVPFEGTFDGTTVKATVTLCALQGTRDLEFWKEADGYHGWWGSNKVPMTFDAPR